jgi:hypothetical protein
VVNDVSRGDRFMPSVSVLGDGSLGIAFYDRRNGGESLDVYAARASFLHGFHVTRNVRVNDTTTVTTDLYEQKPGQSACYAPGRYFGDYLGTGPAPKNGLYAAWSANQVHRYGSLGVWFARVSLPRKYLASNPS